MFMEIAQGYEKEPAPFTPYAPVTDRTAWDNLDAEWREKSLTLGESFLGYEFPRIYATDFMDFCRTGNRTRYEDRFFARRYALNALTLAECIEDQGRFLDDIINAVFVLCEESGWQLPPHNTYVRDEPQYILPDSTAPVLDLFTCETGAALAVAYYLLKDRLETVSPFITKRIRHELKTRILTPYLQEHFWWMGNGKEPMNNWTVWCTQNVLLTVFLTEESPAVRRQVLQKACRSVDYFLAEYGTDGCCDEGAQYYRHAGLCLFNIMEVLNAVTDNAFSSLYQEEKIRNIAAYILNVHVSGKYYVNFADCSPIAGRCGVREFLFGLRTGNDALAQFAAQDFVKGRDNSLLLPEDGSLYYRLQAGFTAAQIKAFCRPKTVIAHPEIFYPSAGLFIARDSRLCLAVKAGDNADSHNHNDTGSFTVYKGGKPLFIDIGVESYTKKTFSPQRYEIWTMQSAWHNLPTVNGVMQQDGEQFCATDIRHCFGDTVSEIEMNLEKTWPDAAGLRFYKRCAALHKEKEIVIRDSFAFRDEGLDCSCVTLSLLTCQKPVPISLSSTDGRTAEASGQAALSSPDCEIALAIGDLGTLLVQSGALLDIETVPITDGRLKEAWPEEIYRILIRAKENGFALRIY